MTVKPGQIYHWPNLMGHGPGTRAVVFSVGVRVVLFTLGVAGKVHREPGNWDPDTDVNMPELLGELEIGQVWVSNGGERYAITSVFCAHNHVESVEFDRYGLVSLASLTDKFTLADVISPKASTQATTVPATCKSRDRGSKCIYPLSHDGPHFNGFNSRW